MKRSAAALQPKLRERQIEATRDLILDALIAQLGETGPFEYSVFEVARRAGVSVRTVYRHFPDREALFGALAARVNQRVGYQPQERSLPDFAALPEQLFRRFDEHEALLLAQLQSSLGAQVRTRTRAEGLAQLRRAIDTHLPHLDEPARARAQAVFASLLSADVWWRMKSEQGLSGADSGAAVSWALRALLEALVAEDAAVPR